MCCFSKKKEWVKFNLTFKHLLSAVAHIWLTCLASDVLRSDVCRISGDIHLVHMITQEFWTPWIPAFPLHNNAMLIHLNNPLLIHLNNPLLIHLNNPLLIHLNNPLLIHLNNPLLIHLNNPLLIHLNNPLLIHLNNPLLIHLTTLCLYYFSNKRNSKPKVQDGEGRGWRLTVGAKKNVFEL